MTKKGKKEDGRWVDEPISGPPLVPGIPPKPWWKKIWDFCVYYYYSKRKKND
jgi:hypothetical protein